MAFKGQYTFLNFVVEIILWAMYGNPVDHGLRLTSTNPQVINQDLSHMHLKLFYSHFRYVH